MLKKYFIYSVYFLSIVTTLLFFFTAIKPTTFIDAFATLFAITIVLYFIGSFFSKIQNKFELISDILLFSTFNIVGFGAAICMLSFFPYSFYLSLANFLASILFFIGFVKRITSYFNLREKTKEADLLIEK